MAAMDLLGRRGALRVLWELRGGPLRFREVQSAAQLSPSVLNARLRELRAARLVALEADGYRLTRQGKALSAPLRALDGWAQKWSASL